MSIEFVKAPIQNTGKQVTPTAEDIRYSYVEGPWGEGGEQAFDRWLAEEQRKAKAEGFDEGVVASGLDLDYTMQLQDQNPYRKQP